MAKNWDANPEKGFSSDSVVVMVVRKGNPKHITGWDDLIKPGVDVITPNPSTSGSARWNILAGYGAQLKEGKTPAQALDYLKTLLTKNVSVQDSSASAALQTFTGGKGDVLLDYESDALAAQKAGDAIQLVYPKQTLLIETPIAVTTKSKHAQQAQAFLDWQWSAAGQTIWAQQGYRPVLAVGGEASSPASSRRRRSCSRSTTWAAGPRCPRRVLRSVRPARSPRSSRPRGCPLPAERPTAGGDCHPRRAGQARRRRRPASPPEADRAPGRARRRRARARHRHALHERVRADPAGCRGGQGRVLRAWARSGTRSTTRWRFARS